MDNLVLLGLVTFIDTGLWRFANGQLASLSGESQRA